jgi:hypothetical protein
VHSQHPNPKERFFQLYSTHSRDEKEDTAHGIVLVEDIRHQSKEFYDENPHTK